jgi:hypothetical protein
MKYRVIFRSRSNQQGEAAEDPASFLDVQLDDQTVLDAVRVERTGPDSMHSSDVLEEDDAFLMGSEVWEYDVADGKDGAFIDALKNSEVVMEYEALESSGDLGLS